MNLLYYICNVLYKWYLYVDYLLCVCFVWDMCECKTFCEKVVYFIEREREKSFVVCEEKEKLWDEERKTKKWSLKFNLCCYCEWYWERQKLTLPRPWSYNINVIKMNKNINNILQNHMVLWDWLYAKKFKYVIYNHQLRL